MNNPRIKTLLRSIENDQYKVNANHLFEKTSKRIVRLNDWCNSVLHEVVPYREAKFIKDYSFVKIIEGDNFTIEIGIKFKTYYYFNKTADMHFYATITNNFNSNKKEFTLSDFNIKDIENQTVNTVFSIVEKKLKKEFYLYGAYGFLQAINNWNVFMVKNFINNNLIPNTSLIDIEATKKSIKRNLKLDFGYWTNINEIKYYTNSLKKQPTLKSVYKADIDLTYFDGDIDELENIVLNAYKSTESEIFV